MRGPEISKKAEYTLFIFVGVLGLILSGFFAASYKPHPDVEQMLQKGIVFQTRGELICHGNRVSGGMGFVPGCLSSLLVGVPMKIWASPYAALTLLILTHALALYFVYRTFREYFEPWVVSFFVLLYCLSPWRLSQVYLWNPSYLFLPVAIHLWTSHQQRKMGDFWHSFAHVLAIVFALQIHPSSVILIGITLLLTLAKALRLDKAGVLLGLAMGMLSLIPFGMEVIARPEFAPNLRGIDGFYFRGLIYFYPILKVVLFWIQFPSLYFPPAIFQKMDFAWWGSFVGRDLIEILWNILRYSIAGGTFIASFIANLEFIRAKPTGLVFSSLHHGDPRQWLKLYCGVSFLSLIVFTAASPITLLEWHVLIIFFAAHVPVLYLVQALGKRRFTHAVLGVFSVGSGFEFLEIQKA